MKILCALLFAASAFAQVYSANVTAGGSAYTTAPTVTATAGGCTTEPTFVSTIATGAVTSVVPTFMGIGCTSAPTLGFSGGGGSSAAATAVLIPATIFVLGSPLSRSGSGLSIDINASYIAWQFVCELTVPQHRVPFYSSVTLSQFRMPGTAQSTQITTSLVIGMTAAQAAAYNTALTNGILTEFSDYYIASSTVTAANIEIAIAAACAAQQTNVNAWNAWAAFGSFFSNGTWTVQGYQ